jgi:two-component system sensor histidine kinase GlrK
MRSYYPRSFPKLLLVALALIALPLVLALITSALAVDRLARLSQTTVYQAAQATQSSRRLIELMTAMERSARQLVILGDRSVLDAYQISRSEFSQTAEQFAALPFDAAQRADLEAIVKQEQQIFGALSNPATPADALQDHVVRFVDLSQRAQAIMSKSNQLIDREVEAMRHAASRAQRIMLWQAFALIPVVIFLVVGFTVLIVRPIRELEDAIRELGKGRFNKPVEVHGPEDLEYLGERLEWMRRQLLGLEQQKNRFLQQVSHELKTPLTALREGAQLLSDEVVGGLTPEQREIAQILRDNGIELQRRIEELLNYGSIQFHKPQLELAAVAPQQILERVTASHKLALQAKSLGLKAPPSDITLIADAEKLRIILDNLLSNAIRFSPAGGTITFSMSRDAAQLTIDVVDEGPGIDAADAPHVFEPFYQGRVQGSGPVKGTGLGLSIVREYVVAHGGSIDIVPTGSGRGAHVRLRLPLAPAEQP